MWPFVLVLGLLTAGCFGPSVADCAIECRADPECPAAMVCAHQRCRPAGLTEACVVADAGTDADAAAPDDSPRFDAAPCVDTAGCRAFTCPGSASCYLDCAAELMWAEASARCAELNGCLVQLESPDEVDCVGEQTSEGPDQPWTAARQADDEDEVAGGWSWRCRDAAKPLDGPWNTNEPNDSGGGENDSEQCGALVFSRLFDVDCDIPRAFVCER